MTPYSQIGIIHGKAAKVQIGRTIDFYDRVFRENANLCWAEVEEIALEFTPLFLKHKRFFEELQGVAHGSDYSVSSIFAINARTEIMYGMMDDGCTALSWKTGESSFLAQNWDWQVEQKENLVVLDVLPKEGPRIKMITEAGIIGKIGLNSAGVGVCFNAIRAKGMDVERMPAHIGLRLVLESTSRKEAVEKLERLGIASACTIVIADETGGTALECNAFGMNKIEMDGKGRVFHSNHFLMEQTDVVDLQTPKDTLLRVKRIEELVDDVKGEPTTEKLFELFKDEQDGTTSICRAKGGESKGATLFNIVSDLKARKAFVTLGRPTEPEEQFWLSFDSK